MSPEAHKSLDDGPVWGDGATLGSGVLLKEVGGSLGSTGPRTYRPALFPDVISGLFWLAVKM